MKERVKPSKSSISRRSFLGKSLAVGAGTIGAGLLANAPTARASGGLTAGDVAILRFLAAAESSKPICGSNTTNSAESRTAKSPEGAGVRPIPRPFRCSMGTCRSTSTTTPRTRSATSRSSTPIWSTKGEPGQSGSVPHPAGQHRDRRPADRAGSPT